MIISNVTEMGALIKNVRQSKNLTQTQLADLIDASRFWVSEIERGKPRAELELVIKALEALELQIHIKPSKNSGI